MWINWARMARLLLVVSFHFWKRLVMLFWLSYRNLPFPACGVQCLYEQLGLILRKGSKSNKPSNLRCDWQGYTTLPASGLVFRKRTWRNNSANADIMAIGLLIDKWYELELEKAMTINSNEAVEKILISGPVSKWNVASSISLVETCFQVASLY